jgi:hypothetical protein
VFLIALLFAIAPPSDVSLPPIWSPDHQVLATTKINERFVTPEGVDYTLFMNGRRAYPPKPKHTFFAAYTNEHTFRSNLTWSPDGQHLAFTEEVYDWHYMDPYNSDFNGYASEKRYFLVVVTRDGKPAGYRLSDIQSGAEPRWDGPDAVSFAGRDFDLRTDPPGKIP